jgi:hypothetical protein
MAAGMMSGMNSWWKSPWWAVGAAVVPAGLMLYGVSVPGGYYRTLVAALWGWAIVWTRVDSDRRGVGPGLSSSASMAAVAARRGTGRVRGKLVGGLR